MPHIDDRRYGGCEGAHFLLLLRLQRRLVPRLLGLHAAGPAPKAQKGLGAASSEVELSRSEGGAQGAMLTLIVHSESDGLRQRRDRRTPKSP